MREGDTCSGMTAARTRARHNVSTTHGFHVPRAWCHAGLPLLQPQHRALTRGPFTAVAKALEGVGSPLGQLRVSLHLEVSRAEADGDALMRVCVLGGGGCRAAAARRAQHRRTLTGVVSLTDVPTKSKLAGLCGCSAQWLVWFRAAHPTTLLRLAGTQAAKEVCSALAINYAPSHEAAAACGYERCLDRCVAGCACGGAAAAASSCWCLNLRTAQLTGTALSACRFLCPLARAARLRGIAAPARPGHGADDEGEAQPEDDVVLLLERARDSKGAALRAEHLRK